MSETHKIKIFTGIRPSGDLTIANYLGAIEPILKLLKDGAEPMVFVADLHALTDNEPSLVKKFVREVVIDYLALGLDPKKTIIFVQSVIGPQLFTLMGYLARHISVSELLRVPTLKDKLKGNARGETANALLLLYPVLMAADILMQRAEQIPVGEDQVAHLEVTRLLAKRFNDRYGEVFPIPRPYQVNSLRILSLKGEGKMSKSSPEGAIFLTDDINTAVKKVKGSITAIEGMMTDGLESNIKVAKSLCKTQDDLSRIDAIISEHMAGKKVMGEFKKILGKVVAEFLTDFQQQREKISQNPSIVDAVLDRGARIAIDNANETMALVERAMFK